MSKFDRKQAIREFKEAIVPQGIYAIVCTATDAKWVGASRNLNAQRNSTWAQLKSGMHLSKSLLSAWKEEGEDHFSFEVLETLPEDISPIVADDARKELKRKWAAELGAEAIG